MSTPEFLISEACPKSISDDASVQLNPVVIAPVSANSVVIQVIAAGVRVIYLQASSKAHNYSAVATCLLGRVQLIHRICSIFIS
jgi:hypothetical protein